MRQSRGASAPDARSRTLRRDVPHSGALAIPLLDELSLNRLEQVPVEDRRMLCGADFALEVDLADVEPVAQEVGERRFFLFPASPE
jgi:hypothetical protein